MDTIKNYVMDELEGYAKMEKVEISAEEADIFADKLDTLLNDQITEEIYKLLKNL